MPRYTPLYRLPALDVTDRARSIADIDWQNAQVIEAILRNQGQPPLGSDLVSLITRLNTLEASSKPFTATMRPPTDVAIGGTTNIGLAMNYASGTNIPSSAWDKSTGALTIPAGGGGMYLLSHGIRCTSGPTQVQAFFGVNGTDAPNRILFNDGITNVISTGPVELKAGDTVAPMGWSNNASAKSTASAMQFVVKRLP